MKETEMKVFNKKYLITDVIMVLCIIVFSMAMISGCAEKGNETDLSGYDFVVDQNGSGDFESVQEAIDAVPDNRDTTQTRIYIKEGTYKEQVTVSNKNGLQLTGEDGTVITYDAYAGEKDYSGKETGTAESASVSIFANDFKAENITFENSSGHKDRQAIAVMAVGERMTFIKCRFIGFMDTLYTEGYDPGLYFEDCYIEGTRDFIFGSGRVVFNRCQINSKRSGLIKSDGVIAALRTAKDEDYGHVFYDCKLTADDDVPAGSVYLGRPWGEYGQCVFIRCDMGAHINPLGWDRWEVPEGEDTFYFAEYKSTGEGAAPGERVEWSHQLTDIGKYEIGEVLAGDDGWTPFLQETEQ